MSGFKVTLENNKKRHEVTVTREEVLERLDLLTWAILGVASEKVDGTSSPKITNLKAQGIGFGEYLASIEEVGQ